MYLDKTQKNKYSVGKQFRKLKRLRRSDPTSKIIPMPPQLQQYYDQLTSQGLQVKNLKFALFQTTNGLKYPGLVATQKILSNTILVKVPVQLLLTTRDAFLSDVQKIFVENPSFYAKRFTSQWQDRIILTFLLYQYQKGKNSRWYNLIRNLPKDIDYAIFWNKQQIQYLQDQWLSKHISKQKQKFEQQCNQLIRILKNYPQFFSIQTITKQNVIWLHTHLVTRCFGKYFEYTTMVPFAQLFNHQCIDVYYTMYYKPGNPHDQKQQFYQQKQLTQKQMDQCQSSDGSYDAQDFIEDDQIVKIQNKNQIWEINNQKYGEQIVKDIKSILYHMFTFINFSDSISLYYVTAVLQNLYYVYYLQTMEQRKKKCQQIHTLNVLYIRKVKQFYKKIKRKYYTYAITQRQKPSSPKPQDIPQQGINYFENQPWPKDKFDQFYMLCSTKDQFQKDSQVFFCYGRLPNKLLLMRYGIALQHNKYDHMFVKIQVQEQIKGNINLSTICQEINIKKYQRFKIKRTKMCVELVTYFRMQQWKYGQSLDRVFLIVDPQLQILILCQTKNFYKELLSQYQNQLPLNQKLLYDKNLSYHKYFALVYKVQQQRMLLQQIKMIEYALFVMEEIKKGKQLKQILENQKQEQKLRWQIMMEVYFKMVEIVKF